MALSQALTDFPGVISFPIAKSAKLTYGIASGCREKLRSLQTVDWTDGMILLRSLGVAGWAVRSVFPLVRRGSIWLPFLLIAAVQGGSLALVLAFGRGAPIPFVGAVMRWIGGEAAAHYPFFYAAVPVLLARWTLLLSTCVFSLATATAVLLFARAWGYDPEVKPWAAAARRYPGILAIGFVTAVLSLLIFLVGQVIPAETLAMNRNLRWGTRLAILGTFLVVQGLLVYAYPWLVLKGSPWTRSLGASARTALHLAIPTLLVVGIPVLLLYPFDYVTGRADIFLTKLRPDLIGSVLFVKIVLEAVLGFFLVGATTRLFLWCTEEEK